MFLIKCSFLSAQLVVMARFTNFLSLLLTLFTLNAYNLYTLIYGASLHFNPLVVITTTCTLLMLTQDLLGSTCLDINKMHFKSFLISKLKLNYNQVLKSRPYKQIGTENIELSTNFLTSNGILHRYSCPYTYEQNGLAERRHRTIVEHGLTLLASASMLMKYWDEAFRASVYLSNRL